MDKTIIQSSIKMHSFWAHLYKEIFSTKIITNLQFNWN